MHKSLCSISYRYTISGIRHVTSRASRIPPPQATQEQIFLGSAVNRPGTDIGTEDDWNAALAAQAQSETQEAMSEAMTGSDDASLFASNRIGQVSLPPELVESVNTILADAHGPHIRDTALRFYESLKLKNEGRTNDVPMPPSKLFTGIEADAYIAGLMPQLYASIYTVLSELRKRLGRDWTPATVLDCGLGPGTAGSAFNEVFVHTNPHPAKERPHLTLIEYNDEMRKRTARLWSTETKPKEKHLNGDTDLYHKLGSTEHKYDLILAPHVLSDVKGRPSERDNLVRDLYNRLSSGGILLLLERGNPIGFEQVARARHLLLRQRPTGSDTSGHIIAPCPHDKQCPLFLHGHQPARRQWCHFSQRLQRPDFLQKTKHAKDNVEDVGYSYILYRKDISRPTKQPDKELSGVTDATRTKGMHVESSTIVDKDIVNASYHWPRIILPPLKRHKHVILDVCSATSKTSTPQVSAENDEGQRSTYQAGEQEELAPGIQRVTIPKSYGALEYKFARKSHWGDLLPFSGKTVMEKVSLDRPTSRAKATKDRIRSRRDHAGRDE